MSVKPYELYKACFILFFYLLFWYFFSVLLHPLSYFVLSPFLVFFLYFCPNKLEQNFLYTMGLYDKKKKPVKHNKSTI